MKWIDDYQLFLFDFDGLLVNTEEMHYKAYIQMMRGRGAELDLNFDEYCQIAHYKADALKDYIYDNYPKLKAEEPDWSVLYGEKKQALVDLVKHGGAHIMPGVEKLLRDLEKADIKRCVVTHSPDELIKEIRRDNPILDTIPLWITREDYTHPKPHPECYKLAISRYAANGDRVIGFEDSPRGLRALMQTEAKPVLICEAHYPEIPDFISQGVSHFTSLEKIIL